MSSAILTMIISHILTFLESELIKEEPDLIASLIHDVQSLVLKLEGLIASKLPAMAPALNASMTNLSVIASDAIQVVGSDIVSGVAVNS